MQTGVPTMFGVITTENVETGQSLVQEARLETRATTVHYSAIEMVNLVDQL